MPAWSSQSFDAAANRVGASADVVRHAKRNARFLQQRSPELPPIFSLKHLSHLCGVRYGFLRDCVERFGDEPYKVFRITKRPLPGEVRARYRMVCVPDDRLMATQRWINGEILQNLNVHTASTAFKKRSSIVTAAARHCRSRWLIKMDIVNFFESVSEQQVFHVFSNAGYQDLVAFELARLCTRRGQQSYARRHPRWFFRDDQPRGIEAYESYLLGHLPQGAPSSPMLANLVMRRFDTWAAEVANEYDLVYSRYADDLTFSSDDPAFTRQNAKSVIAKVYRLLRRSGFDPNYAKTKIVPPGARQIVLGLLVDGDVPRLPKSYRRNLDQHLHFLLRQDIGPVAHAAHRNFTSVYGLKNHVEGLIVHAAQVDAVYAQSAWHKFNQIGWP